MHLYSLNKFITQLHYYTYIFFQIYTKTLYFKKQFFFFKKSLTKKALNIFSRPRKHNFQIPFNYFNSLNKTRKEKILDFKRELKKIKKKRRARLFRRLRKRTFQVKTKKKNYYHVSKNRYWQQNIIYGFISSLEHKKYTKKNQKTFVVILKEKKRRIDSNELVFTYRRNRITHSSFNFWSSDKNFYRDVRVVESNYWRTPLKNFLYLTQLASNPSKNKIFIFFLLNFCSPSFSHFFIKELTKLNKRVEKLTNISPFFFYL